MRTGSVLSSENSTCRGPGVGGSTRYKRIRQSSVAGEPRGRGVVRNEAETGQGTSRALIEKITS